MKLLIIKKFAVFPVLALICLSATAALSQTIVDKMVATVSDGVRTELITYSDLLWQLALQPSLPLQSPNSDDLNRALQLQINQRLFALESERLPRAAATEKEINDKISELISYFPSAAEFEKRLKTVGFDSIKDDNFENIIAQRVAIDKYLDFRFRSFVVITAEDEAKFFRDEFVPDFRRRNPGVIVPSFDEARARVNRSLTETRVATGIEAFLEEAKRRIEIVVLSEP